ncbi:Aovps5, partial [Protomyces lactucae-debilis]
QSTSQERTPSIPLEQAANPTFNIMVGDPVKIGDLTSAHTVYKVSTRTTSKAFKAPECSVTRRFRDFLWLYDQLNRSCPGAIVPPPPEKQAMGRFSENFVEARRYALERMLEKIGKHPVLRGEADFKLFLESETFANDVKHRPVDPRTAQEHSRGFLGLGGAFSMPGKFIESDEFFEQKKAQFDLLDSQLKHLSKAVDVVIKQRRDLAHTTSEFGAALSALSTVELSRSLSNALGSLSDLQIKIQELHERQAQQDLLTLGHTVEEYQRLIGSVKTALSSRQKAWFAWQDADADAAKRRSTSEKIKRQAKTQQDRLNQVDAEHTEAERKAHALKLAFEQVGRLLRSELQRFEMDKVEDFKTSLEMFLESAVEAQKEVIEHWEFYHDLLMQELEED